MTVPTTVKGSDVSLGDELPPFELAVTSTVIVAGAIASRDFMPVHHDPDYARKQGAPDMFMNILTTNGYVSRYVTDWAGPEAMIEKIKIRLGAPALPDMTMHFTGTIERLEKTGSVGKVELSISGATEIGPHVTGQILLTLPVGD